MGILAFAASFLIGWIQETLFYSSILSKIFFVSKDVTEVYLSSKAKTQISPSKSTIENERSVEEMIY